MERLPPSPGFLPLVAETAAECPNGQLHAVSVTADVSASHDLSCDTSTASASTTSSQAAAATAGSKGPRRHSKDDNFVHDGTGIFLPAAIHTVNTGDDFLLSSATALRCPWSNKRHSRRVSHHGDASDPLLPLADEPQRRITLTGTEQLESDKFLLPASAAAVAAQPQAPSDRLSPVWVTASVERKPQQLSGKAAGEAARKYNLPIMIAPDGASTCYITIE